MSWYEDMLELLGGELPLSDQDLHDIKVFENNLLLEADYDAGTNSHSPEEYMGYDN